MLGKTILPTDEELGKKDDDHRYKPAQRSGSSILSPASRWRRRRVLWVVLGFFTISILLHTVRTPISFEGRKRMTIIPTSSPPKKYGETAFGSEGEPVGAPPGVIIGKAGETPHTYDGQIKFYRLAKSLRASTSRTNGYKATNRNVVFAMSSLKSAATLLPMLCDMSKWNRNWVHAVFMGREDIPLDQLLEINGVDKNKCLAFLHDARPDYMEYSTDLRAELTVEAAMSHIHSFLRPQAVIMDDASLEDEFFVKAIRQKMDALDVSLIELPKNRWEDFTWIARLDAESLSNWYLPMVDILIQVPPDSSSVLRLLKSIRNADYKGLRPPRITLELPADLDIALKLRLEKFDWPPDNNPSNGLVLRRRIVNHRATQEESAVRFLELFYPADTNSHVLLLSPQAQLSPQYFHYITYSLLEYKYSSFNEMDNSVLMGLSLELPSVGLDGKKKFTAPVIKDMRDDRYKKLYSDVKGVPFLWQAPSSHATLFYGDKWVELHSFLRNRVVKNTSVAKVKIVSETMPSWTEYMLEFMRARGYALVYPAMTSAEGLVTVHNELYHAPEEFAPEAPKKSDKAEGSPPEVPNEPFLRAPTPPQVPKHAEPPLSPASRPLHLVLPFDGDLPEVLHMPQLLFDGTIVEPGLATKAADEYAAKFQQEVGGCKVHKGKVRKVYKGEAGDLFCHGDEEEGEWVQALRVDNNVAAKGVPEVVAGGVGSVSVSASTKTGVAVGTSVGVSTASGAVKI